MGWRQSSLTTMDADAGGPSQSDRSKASARPGDHPVRGPVRDQDAPFTHPCPGDSAGERLVRGERGRGRRPTARRDIGEGRRRRVHVGVRIGRRASQKIRMRCPTGDDRGCREALSAARCTISATLRSLSAETPTFPCWSTTRRRRASTSRSRSRPGSYGCSASTWRRSREKWPRPSTCSRRPPAG